MNTCYYFRWNGKTYRGSTGETDLESSHTRVKEIIYEVSQGHREKGKQKIIRFEEVVKNFLKYKKLQRVSPKTLHEYRRQSKYLLEKFKGRDINSFQTKQEYNDYKNWRDQYYNTHKERIIPTYKKNGKIVKGRKFEKVGVVTLNRECRLLGSILRFGKEYMNVLKGIEIASYTMIPEDRREEILTYGDYKKLEKYWKEKNPYYWKIISFVDKTGIRYPSELNNILWKDVNFSEGYVEIRNRKSRGSPVNTLIPLLGETKKILEELRSREDISKGNDDPVFVNDKGRRVKNITKSFKKSISELGILKKISMYVFRHTFTTRMVKNPDVPLVMLSYILGHKDTTMLDRRYSHVQGKEVVKTFHRIEEKKKKKLLR
jgi:integrase